jgi:hypothetical protein
MTRSSRDEQCGRTLASMIHPEDLEAECAVMQALITGAVGSSIDEQRYLRPDEGLVWVARSVTVVRDVDGTPLHFLTQVQDITDRQRFESELRHLADHDPLTGLFNRRRFKQELDRHIAEFARYGARGALLISTSTTSSTSTTRSATTPATSSSTASPGCCSSGCAAATSSPASVATSSPCSCPTAARAKRRSSRRISCEPSASRRQ